MRHRRTAVVALVAFLLLAGALGLGLRWWFRTTTPVSSEEALHRFHQQESTARNSAGARMPNAPSQDEERRPSPPGTMGGIERTPSPKPTQPAFRPDRGVYRWKTTGYEEALGIRRSFPPESQRIVTLDGDRRYRYHHFYSEEHQEWFEGRLTPDQILVPYVRSRVAFGPFDAEIEVKFDPAMIFTKVPFAVGQAWEGKWSGDTYGEYTGRLFERTRMKVVDRDVAVWGVHLHFVMHGEVEGEQDLRAWIAPEYQTTVREDYVVTGSLRGKPGTYHGEWTISLLSLNPLR